MRTQYLGRLVVLGLLLGVPFGCSKSDDATALQLSLRNLPERAGSTVWMWLSYADGGKSDVVSAPALPFTELTISPKTTPFNVIVYLPDLDTWAASDTPAAGYYAVKNGVSETAVPLRVSHWIHAGEQVDKENGIKGLSEDDQHGTVSGTVTNSSDEPIEGAMVWVDDQRLAFTDAAGHYSLELLTGRTILHVLGDGMEERQEEIEVAEGVTSSKSYALQVDPKAQTYSFKVQLVDHDTGLPVPFGRMTAFFPDRTATADVDGVLTIEAKSWAIYGEIQADGYSYRAGLFFLSTGQTMKVKLFPLVKEFYGTWTYCLTTNLGNNWKKPIPNGTKFVSSFVTDPGGVPVAKSVSAVTYNEDGTYKLEGDGVIQQPGSYWTAARTPYGLYYIAYPMKFFMGQLGGGVIFPGRSGIKLEGPTMTMGRWGEVPGEPSITPWALSDLWSNETAECPKVDTTPPPPGTLDWPLFCESFCVSLSMRQIERGCVYEGTPPAVLEFAGGDQQECEATCMGDMLIKRTEACVKAYNEDEVRRCVEVLWCDLAALTPPRENYEWCSTDPLKCLIGGPDCYGVPLGDLPPINCDGKNLSRMRQCLPPECVP